MIAFERNEKHNLRLIEYGKLFHITLGSMLLHYFSDLTFVNELYELIKYRLSDKIFLPMVTFVCFVTSKLTLPG